MEKREVLYKRIYLDLLKKIQTNVYKINEMLPTEMELSRIYGVSRPTIRQAIAQLVDDGLVYRKKKAGTIVISNKIVQQFTNQIRSFDSEMLSVGIIPKTNVLDLKEIQETPELRIMYGSSNKDSYYKLIRVRYAKQNPIVLVETIISNIPESNFLNIDFETVSLYDYLRSINHEIIQVKRVIEVALADTELAKILEINEGDPIFAFTSYGFDRENRLIEYSVAKYRGDLNSFAVNLNTQSVSNGG